MIQMEWIGNQTFQYTPLTNLTLGGENVAKYKIVDNLTFAYV